jgi:citrate lyase subunit beta / citryl-CoA lyase
MRSVLFVPGDSDTKLVRAAESDADVVAVDLEDSVAVGSKEAARDMAKGFVADCKRSGKGPRIYVRVNALQTAFAEADITSVMESAPDGILLPKARSGDDVRALCNLLGKLEKQYGIAAGKTEISVLATEVPVALLCMHSFIGSSPRLTGLSWGSEDLSADLGAKATRDANGNLASPFRLARDLCLVTAAAANVGAIDTIFIDLRDAPGLAREAAESARDGFTGKLALHPDQVAVINEAFTPTMAEISGATEVVQAFAKGDSTGVLTLGGEVLDRPHLRRAEGVLARARLAGLLND